MFYYVHYCVDEWVTLYNFSLHGFSRFLQIADKDIQDALLYSLITKEEVKHRKGQRVYRDSTEQQGVCGEQIFAFSM